MCHAVPRALPTHRRALAGASNLKNRAAVASAACQSAGYSAGAYTPPGDLGFNDGGVPQQLLGLVWATIDGFQCSGASWGITGQQRLAGCSHDERTLWRDAHGLQASEGSALLAVQCS